MLIIKMLILLSGGLGCQRAGFFISQLIKVIKGYIINKSYKNLYKVIKQTKSYKRLYKLI